MPLVHKGLKELSYDNFEWNTDAYQAFLCGEKADIGGGTIEKDEIDIICGYPELTSICISGLHQDTFDYFVTTYGKQFKAILFFKNKMVSDLSALGTLDHIEAIGYFLNQRAEQLWDMSGNKHLKMLGINDFSRLHDFSGIEKAPELEYLSFGNLVWAKSKMSCIPNLNDSALKRISFNAAIDYEGLHRFLSIKGLEKLDFRANLYPTEFLAWICANYPDLQGECLKPYIMYDEKSGAICGKRKKYLEDISSEKAQKAIQKAEEDFDKMKKRFAGISFEEIINNIS